MVFELKKRIIGAFTSCREFDSFMKSLHDVSENDIQIVLEEMKGYPDEEFDIPKTTSKKDSLELDFLIAKSFSDSIGNHNLFILTLYRENEDYSFNIVSFSEERIEKFLKRNMKVEDRDYKLSESLLKKYNKNLDFTKYKIERSYVL